LNEIIKSVVILDESYLFGVLGKSRRGLAEHYGVPVIVWCLLLMLKKKILCCKTEELDASGHFLLFLIFSYIVQIDKTWHYF
jgi:hypothetical protein